MIYLFAALLRLFGLGSSPLWYDETFSYSVAALDLRHLLGAVVGDVHPPLYYLVLAPLAHIPGVTEIVLRLPSVALSVLVVWLTGQLATQLGLTRRAAIIGQLVVAVLPGQLAYAQEARMYALFSALVLGWLLLVLRRQWGWAALVGTLTLYTHNYGLFYLVLIGLVALDGELRRPVIINPDYNPYPDMLSWKPCDIANLRGALLAVGIPALAWLPWQLVLFGQMANVAQAYWIQPVTPGGVVYALIQSIWAQYLPAWASILGVIVTLALLIWALLQVRRLGKAAWKPLVLLGFGPLAMAVMVSVLWRPMLLYRGLLPSVPLLGLLVAGALTNLPRPRLAYVSLVTIPLLAAGAWTYYAKIPVYKAEKLNLPAITELRQQWRPGDLVMHSNASTYVPWSVYAPDLAQVVLPTCGPNGGELTEQTRWAMDVYTITGPVRRVWLLVDVGPTTNPCETQRAAALTKDTTPLINLATTAYTSTALYLIEDQP